MSREKPDKVDGEYILSRRDFLPIAAGFASVATELLFNLSAYASDDSQDEESSREKLDKIEALKSELIKDYNVMVHFPSPVRNPMVVVNVNEYVEYLGPKSLNAMILTLEHIKRSYKNYPKPLGNYLNNIIMCRELEIELKGKRYKREAVTFGDKSIKFMFLKIKTSDKVADDLFDQSGVRIHGIEMYDEITFDHEVSHLISKEVNGTEITEDEWVRRVNEEGVNFDKRSYIGSQALVGNDKVRAEGFVRRYSRANHYEDMGTVAELIFGHVTSGELTQSMLGDKILMAKCKALMKIYEANLGMTKEHFVKIWEKRQQRIKAEEVEFLI
jgi:hypothetical protein